MNKTNASDMPFDERVNERADIRDLKYPLIKEFLSNTESVLLNDIDIYDKSELAGKMKIADGPSEYFKPLNVGLLFFNDDPEQFFPYSRIEVVNIPDPTGQGMEEHIFRGPIAEQLSSALRYIKNNVIAERVFKVSGQAEAVRVKNYSYEAIEEFLSNAVYHKSYQIHEPVTVRIESDRIEITSLPGPDRSISDEDIANYQMRTRKYRNRRIGDFLKELHLVEGRNTGIPTAIRAISLNGSPMPKLLTDEDRSYFSVIIPIHELFLTDRTVEPILRNRKKSRSQIKAEIMYELDRQDLSAHELYGRLGYKGNPSRTFNTCIAEMLEDDQIRYSGESPNDPTNVLKKTH